LLAFVGAAALAVAPGAVEATEASEPRVLTFTYQVTIPETASGQKPVDVFVPLPRTDRYQAVLETTVDAPFEGASRTDAVHGNRYWYGQVPADVDVPSIVTMTARVERKVVDLDLSQSGGATELTAAQREEHAVYLGSNARVPIDSDQVKAILADLPASDGTLLGKSRVIYDYVVDNMDYKKTGDGWGHGDTHWACSSKYGNCTDFHALFISLARASGIPARFEIGFPVPQSPAAGDVKGYHCWVQFWIPELGWIPIDASEAKKNPEQREALFGGQPADRILFTIGRDHKLGAGHAAPALNYFVYPHVETAGEPTAGVGKAFRYSD
jgi:transglutaminase-like putative cysteine protease